MNLAAVGAYLLFAGMGVPQDGALAKFGLKPNLLITTTDGRATVAESETIELVGATDIAIPGSKVWDANGRLLDQQRENLFWKILDDRPPAINPDIPIIDRRSSEQYIRTQYSDDPDGRTFAMAFRLSANLTKAVDVAADRNKTFMPMLAQTLPVSGAGPQAFIGERRILKPVLPKDYEGSTFDYRLEVPGGDWTKIAEFPFGPDTKLADGLIDVKMRWKSYSDFRTIDGRQEMVDYKGYYFTVTLPEALREMDMEIVTNDPAEDATRLPDVLSERIRGEDYAKGWEGIDLFTTYGLNSRSATRVFTLRARPKRIVTFKGIPFKRD